VANKKFQGFPSRTSEGVSSPHPYSVLPIWHGHGVQFEVKAFNVFSQVFLYLLRCTCNQYSKPATLRSSYQSLLRLRPRPQVFSFSYLGALRTRHRSRTFPEVRYVPCRKATTPTCTFNETNQLKIPAKHMNPKPNTNQTH